MRCGAIVRGLLLRRVLRRTRAAFRVACLRRLLEPGGHVEMGIARLQMVPSDTDLCQ